MGRLLLLVALTLCACSEGGPGDPTLGGNGISTGGMARLCENVCGWASRCGEGEIDCVAECNQGTAANASKWSTAFVNHAATCFETLPCNAPDDTCVGNFAAVDPSYPNIPEVQSCLMKRSECSSSSSSFSDDYCRSIAALTSAARADASACLARSCGEISSCLRAAGAFSY